MNPDAFAAAAAERGSRSSFGLSGSLGRPLGEELEDRGSGRLRSAWRGSGIRAGAGRFLALVRRERTHIMPCPPLSREP